MILFVLCAIFLVTAQSEDCCNSKRWSAVQENKDVYGQDIGSVSGRAIGQCAAECEKRCNCRAYTWNTYQRGTCWFKGGTDGVISKQGAWTQTRFGCEGETPPPSDSCANKKDHCMSVINSCPHTVWVGTFAQDGRHPLGGGMKLESGQKHTFTMPYGIAATRIWGRTNCVNGRCETGDCGHREKCFVTGAPPATLAEFTFVAHHKLTFYDLSLVDGFNLKMRITPKPGTFKLRDGSKYDCGAPKCLVDFNKICWNDLRQVVNQRVVGCKSGCTALGNPEYCCAGAHNVPEKCPPSKYSRFFKEQCPDAYSYAYDDKTSTYTCMGTVGFDIQFC